MVHKSWKRYRSIQVTDLSILTPILEDPIWAHTLLGKPLSLSSTSLLFIYYHNDSTITADVTPSFILLAIQGLKVVTYVYELHGDQVDVSKSEFSKAS